jgi:tyrosine-protein kinase Etk/Wzc
LKYNETVFELLAKQFEIAKLDEAREGSIIQVVDAAVIPDKRSSPHRLLIVVLTSLTALFVAAFWVVLRQRWSLASDEPENRRRLNAIKEGWKRPPARTRRNGLFG